MVLYCVSQGTTFRMLADTGKERNDWIGSIREHHLVLAVINADVDGVVAFLSSGAQITIADISGWTALKVFQNRHKQ